jgi:hypothetical protein
MTKHTGTSPGVGPDDFTSEEVTTRKPNPRSELAVAVGPLEDKTRADIRDRAAYVFITGTYPTHLRPWHTGVIRAVTSYLRRPTGLDGECGNFKMKDGVVVDLDLRRHPMVMETQARIDTGWRIRVERPNTTRRPYTKVFLWRKPADTMQTETITVQVDGSVKQGWA